MKKTLLALSICFLLHTPVQALDKIRIGFPDFKSGQIFEMIVSDQAMPVGYAVDRGQLESACLVPRRSQPMVDKTAVSTNRTIPDDVSSARIETRVDFSRA